MEGYLFHCSETGGILKDQFIRPVNFQAKLYGLYSVQQKTNPTAELLLNSGASKLNDSPSWIAREAGLASTPPASRQISKESLRRWEKSACEASIIFNQSASFN